MAPRAVRALYAEGLAISMSWAEAAEAGEVLAAEFASRTLDRHDVVEIRLRSSLRQKPPQQHRLELANALLARAVLADHIRIPPAGIPRDDGSVFWLFPALDAAKLNAFGGHCPTFRVHLVLASSALRHREHVRLVG